MLYQMFVYPVVFFMIIIYIVSVWTLEKLYIRINLILDLAEINK